MDGGVALIHPVSTTAWELGPIGTTEGVLGLVGILVIAVLLWWVIRRKQS